MNIFRRIRLLRHANYLEMTPVRMHDHTIGDNGRVTLIVPKFKNPIFRQWLIPPRRSKDFHIHLDDLGSATWLEIDGNRKVKGICEILTAKYGDKIEPVEVRVTKFLTFLYDQRYITFREITREGH
jgi:uncharacterized protein YuzE